MPDRFGQTLKRTIVTLFFTLVLLAFPIDEVYSEDSFLNDQKLQLSYVDFQFYQTKESFYMLPAKKAPIGIFQRTVVSIACGYYHSIALKSDGTVWTWGRNGFGQLGDLTILQRVKPVQVKGPAGVGYLADIQQVAGGFFHSVALKTDMSVWAWGRNEFGQISDGSLIHRFTPVQTMSPDYIGYLTDVVAIASGGNHPIALKEGGTVWAWGANSHGQLGDGTTTLRFAPVQVKGPFGEGYLEDVVSVAGGHGHSIALKSDGTVWAWGRNDFGQLGDGTTNISLTPVQVKGHDGKGYLANIESIATEYFHNIALKSDGTLWSWGRNDFGQLGDGTTSDRHTPVQVKGLNGAGYLKDIADIASGYFHSIALKTNGTLWTWGRNKSGQLGDGTTTDSHIPVQVKGPGGIGYFKDVKAIAGGFFHTVVLKNDLTVWSWGWNEFGQLGDGTTVDRHTPVEVKWE